MLMHQPVKVSGYCASNSTSIRSGAMHHSPTAQGDPLHIEIRQPHKIVATLVNRVCKGGCHVCVPKTWAALSGAQICNCIARRC